MKVRRSLAAALAALVCLGASAAPNVSISDTAHVAEGEIHSGEIVAVFGDVTVDGKVTGDVVVVMGRLHVSGTITGQVVAVMTDTVLEESAWIGGELVNVGGSLERAPGSRVGGEIVNLDFSHVVPFAAEGWSGLWTALFVLKLVRLAALFLILILITALFPDRLTVIADSFPRRWGWALMVGLMAYAGFVIGFLLLLITILGIPLAIALGFVLLATKWLGLAGILYITGRTAARNLFRRDPTHLAAVLGGYAAYALLCLVPFFGFAFAMIMSFLAVGMSLITRFGSEDPSSRAPRAVPAPLPAAAPPAPAAPPIVNR